MASRQHDDFLIIRRAGSIPTVAASGGVFALVGPGLEPEGIPFPTLDFALARGTEIALNSRVSLWDATNAGPAILVGTFRR